MNRARSARLAILAVAMCGLAVPAGGRAQDNAAVAGQVDPGALTIEAVQAHITELEQLQQAGALGDEDTTRLQLYHGALASLQAAEQSAQLGREFDEEEAEAPVELEAVKARLAEPLTELMPSVPPDATLSMLEEALAAAEIDVNSARDRLREIETELEHRATRRTEILQQSAASQQDLDEVIGRLGALPLADESPALTAARSTKLQADQRAVEQLIDLAKQERENYDARSDLIPLRRERWVRRIAQLDKLTAAWQVLVDWDRKELVIPNKIFVTDTVVNWTLSDQILRLVFPVVIEHGSDTELAERVLLEIAREHPNVLNDPAPSTMFKKIGDNGLEIDLRLFIPHIDHFVKV